MPHFPLKCCQQRRSFTFMSWPAFTSGPLPCEDTLVIYFLQALQIITFSLHSASVEMEWKIYRKNILTFRTKMGKEVCAIKRFYQWSEPYSIGWSQSYIISAKLKKLSKICVWWMTLLHQTYQRDNFPISILCKKNIKGNKKATNQILDILVQQIIKVLVSVNIQSGMSYCRFQKKIACLYTSSASVGKLLLHKVQKCSFNRTKEDKTIIDILLI